MTHRICIIIPVYNHHNFIQNTVNALLSLDHDIFLIDDGSTEECHAILEQLSAQYPTVILITLPQNQGKGGAVMTGFQSAFEKGFTHVLQIDADGQHDINDIPKFIEYSKKNPKTLISGRPLYDESVPKARLYGRYITHFWVWVETLSLDIKDSMCGFRIYPLQETCALMQKHSICKRMDFDIEIMVRLYWNDVPMHFIKTRVIYPANGISHFDTLRDNWRITKLHTRLFFEMLPHAPSLIKRKFS